MSKHSAAGCTEDCARSAEYGENPFCVDFLCVDARDLERHLVGAVRLEILQLFFIQSEQPPLPLLV